MHGRITLQDFAANDNDDDSKFSNDDFKMDEEYQDEINEEIVFEEEEGIAGNDGPDLQEDYFQNPIQQHNTAVNRIPVIRGFAVRVTPIFTSKMHALNTFKMGTLLRSNVMQS
jgi:hypothetical protein